MSNQLNELALSAEPDAIEAILDDLDLGDDVGDQPVIEAVEELDDLILEDNELRDLELTTERQEAYQDQVSELDADAGNVEKAKVEKKTKGAKTPRAPRAASTAAPRTPRIDLSSLDAVNFVLEGDASAMSDEDKDAAKTATLALMPSQKKVAEKFDNVFQQLAAGKLPSVYVVQAFKLLDTKKTMSSSDLTGDFKARYSQGTAMSQAGQIMNLFDTLKIATRSKNVLVLNEESVIAQRLRDAIVAAK